MHVKTRETFIAHTRPKACFDTLEPTERPFCTTRGYRESTQDLGYSDRIQRFVVMLR